MEPQIRIAFFDIDGTLASNRIRSTNFMERIPESTKSALKQLKTNGITPVIATGRGLAEVKPFAGALGIDSYIAANGLSLVYEGNEVFQQFLSPELMEKIYIHLKSIDGLTFYIETPEGSILCKDGYHVAENLPGRRGFDEDKIRSYQVYEFTVVGEKLKEAVSLEIEGIKCRMVAPIAMNILPEDISKGTAIEKLLTILELDKSQAIVFGDEENDLEMFQAAGYSVAMGNGVDELKALATYVTDDVDSDGIYNACKYYKLI